MNAREEETRELVLQLEIAEAEVRAGEIHEESRGNSIITDEQVALKMHLSELQESLQILGDGHIAHSIVHAMNRDANILAHYQEIEKVETEDRRMAIELSNRSPGNNTTVGGGSRPLITVIRPPKKTKQIK